ncbi:MAG: chorismate mutase [Acidimicrobiia bacterium]|nr:chorismate mutase [Acidimicrobiia bacterium]
MTDTNEDTPAEISVIRELRRGIDDIDREIVDLLAKRIELAVEIGRLKLQQGVDLRSPDREQGLLSVVRNEADRLGLDVDLVSSWFERILEYSRARQADALDLP